MDKCKSELHIADDDQDNHATMICGLEEGHEGSHIEQYSDVIVIWTRPDQKD